MMDEQRTFTTRRGRVIPVQSFPQMLPEKVHVAAQKKALELFPGNIPTYDVELMGGGIQTFTHDPQSVESDPIATQAWEAWQKTLAERTKYINEKLMQFYILEGTLVSLPDDAAWKAKQEFFGIELPSDPTALLYHYITTVLIADAKDLVGMVDMIMEESGIDEDSLAAARASFRNIVGSQEDSAGRVNGDASGAGRPATVVDIPALHGNGSYGEMATIAEPMGYISG